MMDTGMEMYDEALTIKYAVWIILQWSTQRKTTALFIAFSECSEPVLKGVTFIPISLLKNIHCEVNP